MLSGAHLTLSSAENAEWSARLASGTASGWARPLIAQIGVRAIGLAWGKLEPTEPELAHVYQMWVAPAFRRLGVGRLLLEDLTAWARAAGDRKSTRLNSSHVKISYAVFCLKKKNR